MTVIDIDAISCTDYFWTKQSIRTIVSQWKLLYPETFEVILHLLPLTLLHMLQEPNEIKNTT